MAPNKVELSPEDVQQAVGVSFAALVDVLTRPDSAEGERLRYLGDYMICIALSGTNPSDETARSQIFGNLTEAGVEPNIAKAVSDQAGLRETKRKVFSLAYIPEDEQVLGIKRVRKGRELDEKAFIQGILARRPDAN